MFFGGELPGQGLRSLPFWPMLISLMLHSRQTLVRRLISLHRSLAFAILNTGQLRQRGALHTQRTADTMWQRQAWRGAVSGRDSLRVTVVSHLVIYRRR